MPRDAHDIDPGHRYEADGYDELVTSRYVSNLQPIKDSRRRKRRVRLFMLTLAVSAITAGAVYVMFFRPEDRPVPTTTSPSTEQAPTAASPTGLKDYVSSDQKLRFSHPANWQVDDSQAGLVTVESPVVKLADLGGNQSDAKIVVSLLHPGSDMTGREDDAVAVRDSEKLVYDLPSQNQRAETYISFAGIGTRALSMIFVSGDSGYQTGQYIPALDIKKGDPIITAAFYTCSDSRCADGGGGSYDISPEEWSANEALLVVCDILSSLRVE